MSKQKTIEESEVEDYFREVTAFQCDECGEIMDNNLGFELAAHLEESHGITVEEEELE